MQPCFSTTQCKHFTPISSHIIFINITFHHQIMGPLLAHFIVKSKGFIDHFILLFFILPCPIPFVYLCIHHSHISSSVQVPVVFPGVYFAHYPGASLICHWRIRCTSHFLSPFFVVVNLFPALKHSYLF